MPAVLLVSTLSPVLAWCQEESYPPPTPPRLLPPDAPALTPLDVQVDQFVRIPQARAQFNVTGRGLAVVVIDSGINPHHISFQGENKLLPGRNFSEEGDEDDTTDRNNHGSNVAGIIAASRLSPAEGMPTGIAHEASIIPLKVFPGGQFEKINEALQWVIDHRDEYLEEHGVLISVVNMSLGNRQNLRDLGGVSLGALQTQRELIARLRGMNVVVTVSAGNGYAGVDPQQGMGFPAICPETTSVAAVFDTAIPRRPDGQALVTYLDGGRVFSAHPGRLVVFSQRLSEAAGGAFRTDICAPGFIVTSMGGVPPDGSGIDPARTRSTQDGTSQAGPVVAGTVMLIQQRFRDLTTGGLGGTEAEFARRLPPVDVVEACMRDGGVPIQDDEDAVAQVMDNVVSTGAAFVRLDAVGALTRLDEQLQSDLRNLQFELFRAAEGQEEPVLERASILGQPIRDK